MPLFLCAPLFRVILTKRLLLNDQGLDFAFPMRLNFYEVVGGLKIECEADQTALVDLPFEDYLSYGIENT